MTPFAIGVVAGLLVSQGAINAPRSAFMDCLKRANLTAAAQNITPDQYSSYVREQCAAAADGYKSALVKFDVQNGIKRAQATADADALVQDEIALDGEGYAAKGKFSPKPAQPVQAAAPAPKQD